MYVLKSWNRKPKINAKARYPTGSLFKRLVMKMPGTRIRLINPIISFVISNGNAFVVGTSRRNRIPLSDKRHGIIGELFFIRSHFIY
jgi:hypothetical protein